MVGDAALREVVGADALGAVAAADLALARCGALVDLPLALLLVEARAQHLHRLGAVLVLRLLVLALHHDTGRRSEEHTSELQSLMRISYAVFCLKKKKNQ